VSTTVKEQVVKLLEGLREVNWVIHVINPEYETLPATATVVAYAGQDMARVKAACETALNEYLAPANYRLGEMSPATGGGEVINAPAEGAKPRTQTVYVNELIALLDRTLGVDRVKAVTLKGAAADWALSTPITLPKPGTIGVTVEGGAA